jgi:hypothetical protein
MFGFGQVVTAKEIKKILKNGFLLLPCCVFD